jgi:signal transduction histidine kinase/ligand-binding sensor domain-containing protein/DNA-binding response OmpR family regulator
MKNSTLFFVFLFFCCTITVSNAQQHLWYDSNKLSCSLINKITQDSHGFIWIGTENGLNKFDGWSVTQYFHNNSNPNSLLNNSIQAFLNDKRGDLWVGTGKGLQKYSEYDDAFCSVKFPNNINPDVSNLFQSHRGDIWAVTAGYGIFSIDPITMKAKSLKQINTLCGTLYSQYVFEDHLHRLWIATPNGIMIMISADRKHFKKIRLSINNEKTTITISEDNRFNLLIATITNLFLWNEKTKSFICIKNTDHTWSSINNLVCCRNGSIIVCDQNNGLKYVDIATNTMRKYTSNEIPVNDNYRTLFEDRDQNLWLGCYKSGINMYSSNKPCQFLFTDMSKLIPQGKIASSIYGDNDNNILIGTGGGNLLKLNSNMYMRSSYNVNMDAKSILRDSRGNTWICSFLNSVAIIDKGGIIRKFKPLEGKSVKKIIKDKDNSIYFAVQGEGLACYSNDTHKIKYINENTKLSSSEHLKNNWINTMLCDNNGLIWIGHCTGVNCYDPIHNRFINLGATFPTVVCNALLQDKNGHIWIGTSNGLFEYDKQSKKFIHYRVTYGVPSNYVCGLGQGKNGDIWFSTYNGICRLDHENKKVVCFFSGNGLYDKEYLEGVYYQDAKGYIYFGGIHGITKFMPDSIKNISFLQRPMLTRMFIDNKEISASTKIKKSSIANSIFINAKAINISYKDDNFSFEFSSLNYHDDKNISFEYRIIGLSNSWKATNANENRITFNHLPSGHYIFEVRACENGVKSSNRSFSLNIAPPWYDTVLARIIYVIIVLGIVLMALYYMKLRQHRILQDKIKEKQLDFYINIAHELRSPLTLIISPLTALIKTEKLPMRKDALLTMQRSVNRIVNLVNQLLDIRKIDKGQLKMSFTQVDMVNFIKNQISMFDYQAKKRNINLTFIHDIGELPIWIDQKNFDKVLVNLIDNAFKYTPDSGEIKIVLSSKINNDVKGPLHYYAQINVLDSGIGIENSKLSRIFDRFYQASPNAVGFGLGLNLTKMLVDLHHGSITAANRNDGNGSCFTVCLPIGSEWINDENLEENHKEPNVVPALNSEPFITESIDLKEMELLKSKTRYKVLVVDDDHEMLNYLEHILSQTYKVYSASNGSEAYQMALQKTFDLIISDVVMPEMDGYEFLHKVKSNPNINYIPFILLTSQVESNSRIEGWNAGADAFLAKPFLVDELLTISKNLISGRIQLKGKFSSEHGIEEKMDHIEMKDIDVQFMDRVMKVINENIGNPQLNVEILASEVGYSRVQLHRKIKALTGMAPSDLIRNIRLKQAANLLKEKKVTISQVAYVVGFVNPTFFSSTFKKLYGCTPSEFVGKFRSGN